MLSPGLAPQRLYAQEDFEVPRKLNPAAIADTVDRAIAGGRRAALQEIVARFTAPLPNEEQDKLENLYNLGLGKAHLALGQPRAAMTFFDAVNVEANSEEWVRLTWLRGEAHLIAGQEDLAQRQLGLLVKAGFEPAAAYLRGRIAIAKLTGNVAFKEERLALVNQIHELAELMEDPRATPTGFEPRWLLHAAEGKVMLDGAYRSFAFLKRYLKLCPGDQATARLVLARCIVFNDRDEFDAQVRSAIGDILPSAEISRWSNRLRDVAAAADPTALLLGYADSSDAELSAFRLMWQEDACNRMDAAIQAATRIREGHPFDSDAAIAGERPGYPATLRRFAESALASGYHLSNRRAYQLVVSYLERTPDARDAFAAVHARLAYAVGQYQEAAELTARSLTEQAGNLVWLEANREIMAKSPTPSFYLNHLIALETLRPADLVIQLELGETLARLDQIKGALNHFRVAFAAVPQSLQPRRAQWNAYHAAARASGADAYREFATRVERSLEQDHTHLPPYEQRALLRIADFKREATADRCARAIAACRAAAQAGIADGPAIDSLPALEARLARFTADAEQAKQLAAKRAAIARDEARAAESRRQATQRIEAMMKNREAARTAPSIKRASESSVPYVTPLGQDCPACRGSGVFYGQQCHRCGGAGWLTLDGQSPGYDPDAE